MGKFTKVLLAVIAVIAFASICANAQAIVTDENGTFLVSETGERIAVQCVMTFPFIDLQGEDINSGAKSVVAAAISGIQAPSGTDAFAATTPAQANNALTSIIGEKAKRHCACADSFRAQSREPAFVPR